MPTDGAPPAAESSPAAQEVNTAIPTDPQEYADWRMTGKVQPAKSKAASTPAKETPASDDSDGTAPASEPGSRTQERPRNNADTRLQEVLADLKRAGLTPAELKTFKRAAQAAAPVSDQDVKPASSAAPPEAAKPAVDPAAPQKPDLKKLRADWKGTWEDLESAIDAARDKYAEDMAEYRAQKAVREDRQRQAAQTLEAQYVEKIEAANTRYGDTAATVIQDTSKAIFEPDSGVPNVLRGVIFESPVIVDLLYTIGSKPEDLQSFLNEAKTSPGKALRRLVVTEGLVIAELAKPGSAKTPPAAAGAPAEGDAPGRDDTSGRFTPARKASQAPAPPHEVSGHAGPPADAVDSAFTANDFSRFRDAANRRDLARAKGQ